MSGEAWLTPTDVAKRFRVSTSTVYRWTARGNGLGIRLVCVRIGKYNTRYREDWVDRFAKGEQVPASEALPDVKPPSDTKTKPGPRPTWR